VSLDDHREDLLIAVALTEFLVHYETGAPEFAEPAWQLAADRLVDHNIGSAEVVDALEIRPTTTDATSHSK